MNRRSFNEPAPPRRLPHRWLLVIPFIWQGALAPVINDVAAEPFGLPFPMVWQMAGIFLTSILIGIVFRLDRRAGVEAEEEAFLQSSAQRNGGEQ